MVPWNGCKKSHGSSILFCIWRWNLTYFIVFLLAKDNFSQCNSNIKSIVYYEFINKYIHSCKKKNKLCTVVHLTKRVGTKSVPGDASHMWYISKDFLGFIHAAIKGNIGGNVWSTIINFTPKKHKISKFIWTFDFA